MIRQLEGLRHLAAEELDAALDGDQLSAWHVTFLGKKGRITAALRQIGQLPSEQRPEAGRAANEIRQFLEEAYRVKNEAVKQVVLDRALAEGAIDVTLPGRPPSLGRLHVTTQTLREIYRIFAKMGFDVFQSPEVESDEHNFQLLNMPSDHPARDMWSTFYTTREGVLLRTHTSPGQIHAMRRYCPEPIRVILPGRCYRYEQVTARSEFMFYQVEGLAVGKRVTLADLKGVLVNFAKQMFGEDRQLRFRGSYFPFTEPSIEVDIACNICAGKGCRVCKYSGWVEILGSGVVHPRVLANGGYDPDVFSGFAFGMGPERIAMLKYRIDDIRYFYGNDVRFLHQYS